MCIANYIVAASKTELDAVLQTAWSSDLIEILSMKAQGLGATAIAKALGIERASAYYRMLEAGGWHHAPERRTRAAGTHHCHSS